MDLFGSICILSLFLATFSIQTSVNGVQNTFNVVDFGAVGNGTSDDSLAFTEAWNQTSNANKETPIMIIPKGKTFFVHSLTFNGPCKKNIFVQLSGRIKAPDGPAKWNIEMWRWLEFNGVTGLNINGSGLVNGNGQKWWDKSCKHHPGNIKSNSI